jgi:hypothetical protein
MDASIEEMMYHREEEIGAKLRGRGGDRGQAESELIGV